MSSRAHLHQLVRQLRRQLLWQRDQGVVGIVPATDEARASFEARRQAHQAARQEAVRAELFEEPAKRAKPAAPETRPAKPAAPAAAAQPPKPVEEAKPAPRPPKSDPSTQLYREYKPLYEEIKRPRSRAPQPAAPQPASSDPSTWSPTRKLHWLSKHLSGCTRCPLHEGRTNLVFGEGDPEARLMFVGEGPGYHEDQQGRPFVGPSGELLTKMIRAMGFAREDVYIANMVKCRPPENRNPAPEELMKCTPFLEKQIEVIQPEVIVTLGRVATNALLGVDGSLGSLRGRFHDRDGVAVMPTYHPAYLLRNDSQKAAAWEDLKQVMARLRGDS